MATLHKRRLYIIADAGWPGDDENLGGTDPAAVGMAGNGAPFQGTVAGEIEFGQG